MDRDTRRIQNTKQPSLEFTGKPSLSSMIEGQMAIQKKSNSQLAIYRKKFGQLWKSLMSNNGDQIVERNLNVFGKLKSKVTAKDLIFEKGPDLEITSDAITVTHSFHDVDVSGGSASTDDLETINGGVNGQILILQAKNGSRDIVIKNAVDNIHVKGGSDFTLDSNNDVAFCIKLGGDWYVIITESF